jgi:hypothetical protein
MNAELRPLLPMLIITEPAGTLAVAACSIAFQTDDV